MICGSKTLLSKAALCPKCGGRGKGMRSDTLRHMIQNHRIPKVLEGYQLCLNPDCSVVYFGSEVFTKEDLMTRVWFKETDPDVPVCYCKEVTTGDILEHIVQRGCCQNLQDIQNHTGANTGKECLTKNPAGT
ncbi:conserved hypothetical protein [Desulforamulus reducens MI-1]|uniref:CopZ zinc binding domain-containing protein n=2 Tax=Desulforamulus TaxID=2916693 RepID=A4J1Z8_DESRM|nr:conserved hypothetical protein [Desulforamulus reducens MI-1]